MRCCGLPLNSQITSQSPLPSGRGLYFFCSSQPPHFPQAPGRTTRECRYPRQSSFCPHRSQKRIYSRSRDIEQRGQIGNESPLFNSRISATGIGMRNPTTELGYMKFLGRRVTYLSAGVKSSALSLNTPGRSQ